MRLPPLLPAELVRRDNRFRAAIRINGEELAAHVANPGRLTELLVPGRQVWVTPREGAHRRTPCDLMLIEHDGVLVSLDTRLPNRLFAEALSAGRIVLGEYDGVAAEVALGASRIDFRLTGPHGICWVECKSVTLVIDGVARFPDAPTARGRRHAGELVAAVEAGDAAAIVFVVQRPDARSFAPYPEADPALAAALREAAERGVSVRAFTCCVSLDAIAIEREIPVDLDA